MTQVFRLNLKTGNNSNPVDQDKLFKYCLDNNVIGIGWSVNKLVNNIGEWKSEAEKLIDKKGNKTYGRSFIRAANNMEKIQKDDLIWIRNHGMYYLCRAKDKACFEHNKALDLFCIIKVDIVFVGTLENIPAKIRNSFTVPSAIQQIHTSEAIVASKLIYNKKKNKEFYTIDRNVDNPILLLQSETIEDILGLYLQKNGYYIYSGTNKRSTQTYEYVAVKKKKPYTKAYTQVKTGNATININNFKLILNEENTILYCYAEKSNNILNSEDISSKQVEFISPDMLLEFVTSEDIKKVLPSYVQLILQMVDK